MGQDDPPEFTDFTSSTACDADAEDANRQVVQAFVTAYNNRDEDRLAELVSDTVDIDDLSGIPHLGQDNWTEVSEWANQGWAVDDQFELTRLVMYGGGSVFEVDRINEVLRTNGIDKLRHQGKAHSSNCVISRMVFYSPSGHGASECRFWHVFADELADGNDQSLSGPQACSE